MSRGWRRSSSRKAPSPYVDHMLHHTSGRFPAQEGVDAAAKARHPAGRAALRIAVVQDQEMLQLQLAQGILLGMAREFAVKPTAAPLSFGLKVFLLFIGTCLVTHALSCVHSAFASCERHHSLSSDTLVDVIALSSVFCRATRSCKARGTAVQAACRRVTWGAMMQS